MSRYAVGVLLSLDQLAHVLLSPILFYRFASEDETISSRIGKIKLEAGGPVPWKYPIAKGFDLFLDWVDPNHSIDAIEEDGE